MFQTFETIAEPQKSASRIEQLRRRMRALKLDGFLVPRADEHQGEYVAAGSERLAWLTGFTGSAGLALVLDDRAILFVDGRYTLQAATQTDQAIFSVENLIDRPPKSWIAEELDTGTRIGFDPWLHTIGEVRSLEKACGRAGVELVAMDENPIDLMWPNRPAPPRAPVHIHPVALAGREAADKIDALSRSLVEAGLDATVLTDPASLAWAFNIRGADVPHTPLPLGFAVLRARGRPILFLDKGKLNTETEAYLTQFADLMPPAALETKVSEMAQAGMAFGLDPELAAEQLRLLIGRAEREHSDFPDPARLPRATKNSSELAGMREAHRRDGAAMARFLHWLDSQPARTIDEIAAARKLEDFRRQAGEKAQMPLRDIAFDTISGAGPNGAIIHYRVTKDTARLLNENELYLVDSGAQYQDGTTDITRTVILGTPDDHIRDRYTRVLKGLIALSLMRFPAGTRGMDLDPFARAALWRAGLDYAHGTGHGVGAYLSVHEGPARIAKSGSHKLLPGMILSNEPGYYKPGAYGIRLENLIVVTPAQSLPDGDIDMHAFETLTLVPFDCRLIDPALLAPEERVWLDAFHMRVRDEIAPLLEGSAKKWLEGATAPLAANQPTR